MPQPEIDFHSSASTGIIRRLVAQLGDFVHRVAPRVIKWVAHVQCGCLATRERLARHGIGGVTYPACLCCGELAVGRH